MLLMSARDNTKNTVEIGRLTMCCTPSSSIFLSADKATTGNIGKCGSLAITQGDIEMLPFARLLTAKKSRHDGVARVQTRSQICDSDTNLDRGAITRAGNVHQAKFRLHHHVIARSLRVRTALAVSSNGSIDQGRVDLVDSIEVQTVLLQRSRDVILDKDVALGRQLVENVNTGRVLEGQAQRLLIPVHLGRVSFWAAEASRESIAHT